MWKRNALYEICKYLCKRGISPEEIASLFRLASYSRLVLVDGEVDALTFEKLHGKGSRWRAKL